MFGCNGFVTVLTTCAFIAAIGIVVGITTALFGFGGGFVTVPIIAVIDAHLGADALAVATATSALVMLVNAIVATAATERTILAELQGQHALLALLAVGGAAGAFAGKIAPGWALSWGFVLYVVATIVDLVARPGFLAPQPVEAQTEQQPEAARPRHAIASWLGLPIGTLAATLGVGGSVMTVPLMRRAGSSMRIATTLANSLTLAIVAPALLVSLSMQPGDPHGPWFIGSVDVGAGLALLAGAIPTIVWLRRRIPHISERLHAWGYISLLALSAATVAITSLWAL